ncbi:hypothetical protein [Gaopeijia maritima]|uniref:hypothetical protein n=1 Tax=Gaopeijia maritima TaxID=3119007 RepID=UPI003283436C
MPKTTWSESAGRRGYGDRPSSRVRVYERADSPGRIHLELGWVDGPGRTKVLKHGTTREVAIHLAEVTARKREEIILRGLDAFGEQKQLCLFELLDRYHDPKQNRRARKWSERHRLEQDRCRDFWKRTLGDIPVTMEAMPQTKVEAAAGNAADAREWSSRTEAKYLKYLAAATRWGRRKARLIDEDPLLGIDLPEVHYDTRTRVYTVDEARKLMEPRDDVDWRVTLAFALAAVHGRRISAILHLWAGRDDAEQEPDWAILEVEVQQLGASPRRVERMFLHYRAEYDKGGRDEWVPVPPEVRRLVESALEREEVQASGWLFPEGRLDFSDTRDKPMRAESIITALHAAEKAVGVATVKGRGFHGAKRLHVTKGLQVAGGDATRVGDVTGNVSEHVLKTIYRQKELGQMVQQVDGVAALLRGSVAENTDTKTDRRGRG